MDIRYLISLVDDAVSVSTARCQIPLFGRWCEMTVTAYCLGDSYQQAAATAITFGIQDLSQRDLRSERRQDGLRDGILTLARGSDGNRQQFEQHLSIPRIIGQLLDYSDLSGGVPAGRTLVRSVLRRTESIVETIRQHIRNSVGADVRDLTLQTLSHRYHRATEQTLQSFLGAIHWRLLLSKSGCDTDCLDVVEYSFAHNFPRLYNLLHDDATNIPLIANAPLYRFDRTTVANIKATALLKNVCGETMATEFDKVGHITVKAHGYRFVIKPGQSVECTDPNGKSARLCIHTMNFSVNPIDEVVIAYLHLMHKFDDYMKLAIVHGGGGFRTDIRTIAA